MSFSPQSARLVSTSFPICFANYLLLPRIVLLPLIPSCCSTKRAPINNGTRHDMWNNLFNCKELPILIETLLNKSVCHIDLIQRYLRILIVIYHIPKHVQSTVAQFICDVHILTLMTILSLRNPVERNPLSTSTIINIMHTYTHMYNEIWNWRPRPY